MASTGKTEHYRLNRWALSDQILMEDFNADNETLDAALHALSDSLVQRAGALQSAIGSGGHTCRLIHGSYVGSGENKTLSCPFYPVAVYLTEARESGVNHSSVLLRGVTLASAYSTAKVHPVWGECSVAFDYYTDEGDTYYYLVLGYSD